MHESPYPGGKGAASRLYDSAKGINLIEKAMPLLKMGAGEQAYSLPLLPERYTGHTLGESPGNIR